jgi:GntR family transcriptional regulator
VILERRYVVAELCPGLTAEAVEGSLYALWTDRFQLAIAGADEIIRAVSIRGRQARHLKVRDKAAGLLVRSLGVLDDQRPLWWEQTLYRGNAYEFHNRLGPVQSLRPAAGVLRRTETT